jgi:cyclic pyranopterin phosphate synthase
MSQLTHFDEQGASRMVDVGDKSITARMARAQAIVHMRPETLELIRNRKAVKGDVLEVARLAGIMAAKKTADLIPLCHVLPLDAIWIDYQFPDERSIHVECTAKATARTGVEMEALVAASVCALTIYDMCKAVDRGMLIAEICLLEKSGGKSGSYVRPAESS